MTTPASANLGILKEDLSRSLTNLQRYRRQNKSKAAIAVIAASAISASTTVAIGVASIVPSLSSLFQILALILSSSMTVLTAWDGLFNHKKLWLLQSGIINSLYRIDSDIRHLEASGGIDQQLINELYGRYNSAFDDYNAQWTEMRVADADASKAAFARNKLA